MSAPPNGTTPADFARAQACPPVLSSDDRGWSHVSLHRFQVPHFNIRLGASCLHRVTLHLAGPVLIERSREGRRDCRWSRDGLSNVVPAGVPVTRSFRGQADFLAVYLASEVVAEVAADAFGLDPSRVELVESLAAFDETLARLARLLMAEAEAGEAAGARLFTDMLARALALHLLRAYSDRRDAALRRTRRPGRLAAAPCDRIHARQHRGGHPAGPPRRHGGPEPLAFRAGVPRRHGRGASSLPDPPPRRGGRPLLEQTRLPIIDVGLRCGFTQASHFATTFRKAMGLSPRAYRAARRM